MKKLFQSLAGLGESLPALLITELRSQLDYYYHLNDLIKELEAKLKLLNKDN